MSYLLGVLVVYSVGTIRRCRGMQVQGPDAVGYSDYLVSSFVVTSDEMLFRQ